MINVTNLQNRLNDIDEMILNLTTTLSHENGHSENSVFQPVTIDSFIPAIQDFIRDKKNISLNSTEKWKSAFKDEYEFRSYLSEFLFTPGIGMKSEWMKALKFSANDTLQCGKIAPPIELISFPIKNVQ